MTEKEKEYRRERMVRSLTKCNLLTMGCKTTGQVARQLPATSGAEALLLYEDQCVSYAAQPRRCSNIVSCKT